MVASDSADEGRLRALRRLADSPPDVSERFAEASSEAVSEVWAVSTLAPHRAEPFWHERFRMPRGRTLPGEPQARVGIEHYLLDDRPRVLAVEELEAPSGHRLVEVSEHGRDRVRSVQSCDDDLEAVRPSETVPIEKPRGRHDSSAGRSGRSRRSGGTARPGSSATSAIVKGVSPSSGSLRTAGLRTELDSAITAAR